MAATKSARRQHNRKPVLLQSKTTTQGHQATDGDDYVCATDCPRCDDDGQPKRTPFCCCVFFAPLYANLWLPFIQSRVQPPHPPQTPHPRPSFPPFSPPTAPPLFSPTKNMNTSAFPAYQRLRPHHQFQQCVGEQTPQLLHGQTSGSCPCFLCLFCFSKAQMDVRAIRG